MSGVITAGAVIGGVVGGGSSLININKQNKQKTKAFLKQMEYLQRNYNYNQAALDRQERSKYDSALTDLFTMSLNSYQNNSQIEAALAETGTEGRSSDKILQTVRGQSARRETSHKEAYLTDVWNVRGQKEALYISTKAEVEQARDQLSASYIHGTQALGQFINGVATGAALGAATAGMASSIGGAVGGTAASASAAPVITDTGVLVSAGAGAADAGLAGAGAAGAGALSTESALALGTTAGGAVGTTMQQAASTGTSAINAATTGSKIGFMDKVVANWDSYDKYLKFYNKIANYGYTFQQATTRHRGYYY